MVVGYNGVSELLSFIAIKIDFILEWIQMKIKKWMLWSVGGLVVVLLIGIFSLNAISNYVLRSMVSSAKGIEKTSEVLNMNKTLEGSKSQQDSKPVDAVEVIKPIAPQELEEIIKPNESQAEPPSSSKPSPKPEASSTAPKVDSKPQQPPAKDTKLTYQAEVSPEKAQKVEESITLADKAKVMAVMLRKLDADEISMFMKMASNGMSIDEKVEAKKMILKKLTEEEYNQLISVASKYGLSQGKPYKESVVEMSDK